MKKKILRKGPRRKQSPKRMVINFAKAFAITVLVGALAITVVGSILAASIIQEVSKRDPETLFLNEQSIILDKNGNEVAAVGEQRKNLDYNEIPEVFVQALLATEDSRFFAHDGVDRPRFLSASLKGGQAGGASTLTMQVSKNRFTKKDQSLESTKEKVERKIQDLYVSTNVLEKTYTKEEILAFYSNVLYLGNYSYGLAAASNNYFQKTPQELNLAEAAFIAGLFQEPYGLDPTINGTANAERRRNTVLNLMERHGYITKEQSEATKQIPLASYLKPTSLFNSTKVEYTDYINAVIDEVKVKTGLNPYKDSMKIYTNMDPVVQTHLYDVKNRQYFYNEKVLVASTIVDNSNGTVAGILSGRETNEVGLNYATALQQPGSTAKPLIDYAPCFEQGKCSSINETIADEKYTYTDGTPIKNWDNSYMGTLTLQKALSESRNIPALKIFQRNDPDVTVKMAQSMGLKLGIDPSNGVFYEAHSIGGYTGESTLSLAGGYSAFARGGVYSEPTTISKVIVDYGIPDAEEIIIDNPTKRVMKEATADAINQMLSSTRTGYFDEIDGYGVNFALKTGTSNWAEDAMAKAGLGGGVSGSRDNWIAVYSPQYTTTLWYGYDRLDPEYVRNGWYMKSWSEINIKYQVGKDIALGPHQPREWADFPGWGTANTATIQKEVATGDKDDDSDGIKNKADACPDTPAGDNVDGNGCTVVAPPVTTQNDTDKDGVYDSVDRCPGTALGTAVDANGCDKKTSSQTRQVLSFKETILYSVRKYKLI